MNRRVLFLLVLSAVPALAACGDNAPTKQEYLAKADPVCKRGNDASSVLTTPTDMAPLKEFGDKLAANLDKTVTEVEKLKRPKGADGDAAEEMVKSLRDAAAAARTIGPEVDKGNFTGVETNATKTVDAVKAADAKARALGSTECGKGEAEAVGRLSSSLAATVKKGYIAKVDPICAAANKVLEDMDEPETEAAAKEYLSKVLATAEKLTADIRAVPAPVTDKGKLDEALASFDGVISKTKELQAAITAGDRRKAASVGEDLAEASEAAEGKADAYGFKDCGSE